MGNETEKGIINRALSRLLNAEERVSAIRENFIPDREKVTLSELHYALKDIEAVRCDLECLSADEDRQQECACVKGQVMGSTLAKCLYCEAKASQQDREAAIKDLRMDELDAVMHSVDKWFDEGEPLLSQNPATRAAFARERALQLIEAAEEREATLKAENERLSEALDAEKKHRAWMFTNLETALGQLDKDHPAYGPVAAAAFIETRPLTATETAYGATLVKQWEGKP